VKKVIEKKTKLKSKQETVHKERTLESRRAWQCGQESWGFWVTKIACIFFYFFYFFFVRKGNGGNEFLRVKRECYVRLVWFYLCCVYWLCDWFTFTDSLVWSEWLRYSFCCSFLQRAKHCEQCESTLFDSDNWCLLPTEERFLTRPEFLFTGQIPARPKPFNQMQTIRFF
jgi:hypothetical protein